MTSIHSIPHKYLSLLLNIALPQMETPIPIIIIVIIFITIILLLSGSLSVINFV